MSGSTGTVTHLQILSAFKADIPRYLIPSEIASKYVGPCQSFLDSLDIDSLKRRRAELRAEVSKLITTVLAGHYEPPLTAYLREIPYELLCFYIDRVLTLELELTRVAHRSSETVKRPASWRYYWLQLLTTGQV
ncbi:MAG: hypothetical protein AAB344_00285 [Bacteroidota bacterium]